jgi:hypothetical protein
MSLRSPPGMKTVRWPAEERSVGILTPHPLSFFGEGEGRLGTLQ